MKTVSYTNMRENLADVMEEVANGEQICFTRRGHAPMIIAKVGSPTEEQLEESMQKKREKAIERLKQRHEKTLQVLADK